MALLTDNERARRQLERDRRAAADAARRRLNREPADADASQTVWSAGQLPLPRSASVGVPFSEGVSSVFIGAIAYLPLGLVTGYYPWNYPVAAVLVLVLSYAIWSRRVVVGPGFVAVRKFGPYRLASARSVTSGALVDSQRGGVLKLRTGDGRTMRLRRIPAGGERRAAFLRPVHRTPVRPERDAAARPTVARRLRPSPVPARRGAVAAPGKRSLPVGAAV